MRFKGAAELGGIVAESLCLPPCNSLLVMRLSRATLYVPAFVPEKGEDLRLPLPEAATQQQ
jgi:hypothetical protein